MNQSKVFHVFILLGMIFILGCNVISGQESWTIINQTDLKKGTNTVGFLNEAFGITVGSNGQIYYTPDKGQTWSDGACSSWCLFGLDIVDRQTIWSSGNAANVRRSQDGSKTWQAVTDFGAFEPNHCRFIRFLDAQTGWVANLKQVGSTTDGGKTWSTLILPRGSQAIVAIDLRTKDDGYLLDMSGTLYCTQDQGKTWSSCALNLGDQEKIISPKYSALSAVRFRDALTGTIILALEDTAGKKFVGLHTQNRGKTWKRASLPLEFNSTRSIFLAHDGMTLTHYDPYSQKPITVLQYK